MPKDNTIRKVLVIGSGPIVIGQAAEFDYAGAQACRVLRDEGINVVLVNSNPATIMTDKHLADEIYLEPLNAETLRRIIEKERPDGLLAGLGGQTGLTLAMQLDRNGTLREFGVRLLGSDISAIEKAEDREKFRDTMEQIGQPCVPSEIAEDLETAIAAARRIGYPVIVRPAYTLGGTGGGIAYDEETFKTIAKGGLDQSPITQILVEKCISGWKEIEFETMRDALGNVIAVCSMENVDPVGIHTGDSIVVAPALTLSDKEYQLLRGAALDMVTAIGIVGGCNCQFALNPDSFEYAVIEVNPRVSRSSALASKATGYPIAKITTRIALGYSLDEIANDITGKTCACFEPTVDYIVCKFPKWPFDKFAGSSRTLGTQMKATGEVMSIGQSFEEALMKAVRGAEISLDTLNCPPLSGAPVLERLHDQNDHRIFTVFEALKQGISVDTIFDITKIDRLFLYRLQHLADYEKTDRASAWAIRMPPSAAFPVPKHCRPLPWAIRWSIPAVPSLTRGHPTSMPAATRPVNPAPSHAPESRLSWCSAPVRSASARALSSTIPPSTAYGRFGKWAMTWSSSTTTPRPFPPTTIPQTVCTLNRSAPRMSCTSLKWSIPSALWSPSADRQPSN